MNMIASPAALAQLCEALPSAPVLAIDTEFVRVRTYFPALCLIQINDGSNLYCVDTVAVEDIAPLMQAMNDNAGALILHAGRQDFETMYLRSKLLPRAVWDTQIAAAMAGYGEQVSYGQLVTELTGVELAKSQTRTNWAKRPLSDRQLAYAADDVRYLPRIRDDLDARLGELGRRAWLLDECQRLLDPKLYEPDVARAYRKCKTRGRFTPRQRGAWRNLCALREQTAVRRDRPRRWIIDDDALDALAQLSPDDADGINTVLRQAKANRAVRVDDVAAAIDAAEEVEDTRRQRLEPEEQALVDRGLAKVRGVAKELDVNASLLATRRDIVRLVQGSDPDRLLGGWREAVIGPALRAALDIND